jgi:hypothetical protein
VLEAIEAAFPSPSTFTVKALEDVVGASPGTLQTHLRDLTRMGKVHREGRDESGAILFQLGTAKDPEGEAAGMDDVTVSEGVAQEQVDLLPEKAKEEPVAAQVEEPTVEPVPEVTVSQDIADAFGMADLPGVTVEPVAEEPAQATPTVTFPDDEELGSLERDGLRALAAKLAEQGVVVARASKLGRTDLAQAIANLRDGAAA